jgi:hypothetical protein
MTNTQTKQIDFTKPLRTKSGKKARVIVTTAKGSYPLVVLLEDPYGEETPESYTINGKYYDDGSLSSDDLENVSETKVNYSGIYLLDNGYAGVQGNAMFSKAIPRETSHSRSPLIKILETRNTNGVIEIILHDV